MKETEQTLFLKSNILHIRTNEGEFKVSNPESIGFFESGNFFLKSDEWGTGFLTDPIEWPYGVELIKQRGAINLKLARLLPKEEKKHEWTTDEIMSMVEKKPAQPTPNFPKGGTTFTESAYKEFEKPDFYTESLRVYPNNVTDKYLWDGPHKAGINPKWQRSQDETETFARCRQEGCEHVWNTHVVPLESENKALREEINALNVDIQSYRNGHEANAKRYNDLLIERNKLKERDRETEGRGV